MVAWWSIHVECWLVTCLVDGLLIMLNAELINVGTCCCWCCYGEFTNFSIWSSTFFPNFRHCMQSWSSIIVRNGTRPECWLKSIRVLGRTNHKRWERDRTLDLWAESHLLMPGQSLSRAKKYPSCCLDWTACFLPNSHLNLRSNHIWMRVIRYEASWFPNHADCIIKDFVTD